ncbi:MAG TPA: hypothetical protein VNZ57_06725 [Longimicrobiales bacterium]|nr:hypothetical protein [Longimicrobiales bacterium]
MTKLHRVAGGLFALALVIALPGALAAQETPTSVATAEAQEFLGDWTVSLDSEMGPFSFTVHLTDAEGKVAGRIATEMMGAPESVNAERVVKQGNNLRIDYTAEFDGQPIPISVFIIPAEGGSYRASLDVAGGMFSASGTATRS